MCPCRPCSGESRAGCKLQLLGNGNKAGYRRCEPTRVPPKQTPAISRRAWLRWMCPDQREDAAAALAPTGSLMCSTCTTVSPSWFLSYRYNVSILSERGVFSVFCFLACCIFSLNASQQTKVARIALRCFILSRFSISIQFAVHLGQKFLSDLLSRHPSSGSQ